MTRQDVKGSELAAQIGRMANKFKKMGMGEGDHVAIVGLNHLNYFPAKLGVVATGAVPVLFNPMHNSKTKIMKYLFVTFTTSLAFYHICKIEPTSKLFQRSIACRSRNEQTAQYK